MINIISKSYLSTEVTGPKKVVDNLIKGLNILNYPYCINKDLNSTSQLWIHDDLEALKEASERNLKAIVGPNIYILPREISDDINLSNFLYIHPSQWVIDFWKSLKFDRCNLEPWATGIDSEEFSERAKPETDEGGFVLLYFKQRFKEELEYVVEIFKKEKISYKILHYGFYEQEEYIKALKKTRYILWLGRQESQGIALEEALSMNVPILVWDVLNLGHWVPPNRKGVNLFTKKENEYSNTTSAYYFSDDCGLRIKKKEELNNAIKFMEKNWSQFQPRKYILNNLRLEKQAKEFIELFHKYCNITYEAGAREVLLTNKKWRNERFSFKFYNFLKGSAKKIQKFIKRLSEYF